MASSKRRIVITYNPGSTNAEANAALVDEFLSNPIFVDRTVLQFPDKATPEDRQKVLYEYIAQNTKFTKEEVVCIATRGAILINARPGVTRVDDNVLRACKAGYFGTVHACNNAPTDGYAVAKQLNIEHEVYFADPVSSEDPEYNQASKMSGIKDLPIESHAHYLALREMITVYANKKSIREDKVNGIFIYAGGGAFSIAAVKNGKIVAVSNPNQVGPPGITRCCDIPTLDFALYIRHLVISEGMDDKAITKLLLKKSGLMSHLGHLGVKNFKDLVKLARDGNDEVLEVLDKWYKRIAQEVGKRLVDIGYQADILYWSGKMTAATELTDGVYEHLKMIIPENDLNAEDLEMLSLARQVIKAFLGQAEVNQYEYAA